MDKNIANRRRRFYLNVLASSYLLLGGLSYGQATEYTISTVAGTGVSGFSGDGGLAIDAQLATPRYAVVNSVDGNLYIADSFNNVIRMVNADGVITTVVGEYSCTNDNAKGIDCGKYSGDGEDATKAQLNRPFGLVFDSSGSLYFTDAGNNRIRKVGIDHIITTIAGNENTGDMLNGGCSGLFNDIGDGLHPLRATLSQPLGLGFWGNDLYIAEYRSCRIRKIAGYKSVNPSISTVAGNGTSGSAGDGGLAINAQINRPRMMAWDSKGNLYIADSDNNRIRKVDTNGYISTYVGTGLADYGGDDTCGKLTTEVRLNSPRGILIDPQDNLYISDSGNHRIRKVDTQGCTITIAGNGRSEDNGDGGLATQASFVTPVGISMDNPGNIYVADPDSHKIRKLTPSVEITSKFPSPICTGSSFNLTIQVKTVTPIDTAQLDLQFDPTQLKVNSITNSGILDFESANTYDNTAGTIQFIAGAWNNPAPTSDFDLFTINFTALGTTSFTTLLSFLDSSALLSKGKIVPYLVNNEPLKISACLNYQVTLQRAKPRGNASWKTDLKVSVGTATHAKEYLSTTDVNGNGFLPLDSPLTTNDYFCVKGSHTLANKIKVTFPVPNPLNFGTLWEGDAVDKNNQGKPTIDQYGKLDGDNAITVHDFSFVTNHKGCQGTPNYHSQADFNADNCINQLDGNFLKSVKLGGNLGKVSACTKSILPGIAWRKGRRKEDKTINLNAIPANLTVGQAFDVTVVVDSSQEKLVNSAAAYLNFDPAQLRVNYLTAGEAFDFLLQEDFDNTQGQVNFAAGVWDNQPPTSPFALVTLNLTLLKAGGEQTLSFSYEEPRETTAVAIDKSYLLVTLGDFTARRENDGVLLTWNTNAELDNVGFYVWRAQPPQGATCQNTPVATMKEVVKLNRFPVNSKGSLLQGMFYSYQDTTTVPGIAYCYALEDISFGGISTYHLDRLISISTQ